MKATIHNVNPIPLLKVDLESEEKLLVEEVEAIKSVTDLKLRVGETPGSTSLQLSKSTTIIEDLNLTRLGLLFDKYVKVYTKDVIGIKNNFSRTHSWITITRKEKYHPGHWHPNAMISAVLYFNENLTQEEMSLLKIKCPGTDAIFNKFKFLLECEKDTIYNYKNYDLYPVSNRMFIFPADLDHGTNISTSSLNRYALACNYFLNDTLNPASSLEKLTVFSAG